MGSTINERVVTLIEAVGKNTSSFARSIDKAYTSIESIVKGKTKPSFDLMEAIFKFYPAVNPNWLLTGEGEIFKSKETEPLKDDDYLQDHLFKLEENFVSLLEQLKVKDHQLETKDSQLVAKDQHIERLTRMLETFVGKPEGVTDEPLSIYTLLFGNMLEEYKALALDQVKAPVKKMQKRGSKVGGTPSLKSGNALILK